MPPPKNPAITFRAPPEIIAQIDAYAEGAGCTRSKAVLRLVERGLAVGSPAKKR